MKSAKPKRPPAARRRKIWFVGILSVVFVWACLPARPFRPVEPLPAGIVDMHCHIAGIGAGGSGCFVSPRLRNNWRFNIYLHSFGVTRKEMLAQGDALVADRISESVAQSKYVSKVVLLALDGVIGADGQLDTNRTEAYVPHLSLRQKWSIWRIKNPWDRDVLTKHDLGTPTETFARSAKMFAGEPLTSP